MLGVDKIGEIRRAYYRDGRSIKGICRDLGVPHATARPLPGDQGTGRAVTGVVGTIFFEQPNSAYAEFGWLPWAVLSV